MEEEEAVGDRRRRGGWVGEEEYSEEEEVRTADSSKSSGYVRHRRNTIADNDGDTAAGRCDPPSSSPPLTHSLTCSLTQSHLLLSQLTLHTSPHQPGIPSSSWGCVSYWYYWWLQECTCCRTDHTHCKYLVTARAITMTSL